MPPGTAVTLCGVVVTAVDGFGELQGGVYVMDPAGGPYSGVGVRITNPAVSAGIQVGDLIDVRGGVKDEFALTSDTTGRTITQVNAPMGGALSLSKVGDGTVPVPQLVDPRALAASDEEAEKWEGVLVKVQEVAVIRAPSGVSSSDPTLTEMTTTGPLRVGGTLTALDPAVIQRDQCFAEIVGIGDYFFNYKILPRTPADLVSGGTGCPAPEEGEAACSDSEDNDADGFVDCADFSCQDSVSACRSDTTVVDLQNGTVPGDTQVNLTGVVVTALNSCRSSFWIKDAGGAAQYNGIFVFRGGCSAPVNELPPEIIVGGIVNISARVTEFNTLTELTDPTITFVGGGGAVEPLTGVSYTTLADAAATEPYEGVLMRLQNVRVVNPTFDQFSFSIGDEATQLRVGDFIYRHTPQQGECLAELTGIMHRFSTGVSLLPRDLEDVVVGGSCN